MNGAQETILHAKVSQEMTVNQLDDKMDDKEWHAEVFKWYGVRSNEMTSGMTMHEIADTLKDAGINENFYSMEQSSGFYDHDGWYGNLEEIGMQRLIPERTHVLRLIPAMRLAFSDFKLNHSLSFVHGLLCSEDRDLIARAHEEDADVRMHIKQAKIYFKGTRSPLQGSGIEIYLEGGQSKDSGEVKSDNNGALMTPSTNETIRDPEEVIFEGDGPEEAQDRDDGASPDDDWLEDDDWLKAARWHEAYDWLEDDQLPEDNGSEALSFEVNPQDRDDGATSDDEWFEETGSEVDSNEDLQNSPDPQGPDDESAFDDESSSKDDADGATFNEDMPEKPATQMSCSNFNLVGRKFTDDGMYKQQGLAQADTCPWTSPRISEHSKRLREDYSTAPVSEPDQKK